MFMFETFQETFKSVFRKEKGAILVIFALSLIPLLGIAALVIDRANIFYDKLTLQSCADSAVLGGVGALNSNNCNGNGKRNGKGECKNNGNEKGNNGNGNGNENNTVEASSKASYLYAANILYLGITPSYTVSVPNNQQVQISTQYTSPTLLAYIILPSWKNTKCNIISDAGISPSTGSIILIDGPS